MLIVCLFFAISSAQSVEDIVEEIQERYEGLENLSAEFKQVEIFQLTGSDNCYRWCYGMDLLHV
jgi:outer membrane lipoprotein-sorting protein